MKTTNIAAAVACALAVTTLAQASPPRQEHRIIVEERDTLAGPGSRKSADAWRRWGDDLRASLGTMYGESFSSAKSVKGAPYSADVSTEVNQTLADGNVIAKKTTGRVFRDGEGRTRQETVVNGEARSIQLRDPVGESAVMLLPGSKKAVRMPHLSSHSNAKEVRVLRLGDREIRIEDGTVTVDGKEAKGKVEITAGGKVIRVEDGKVTVDGKEITPGEGGKKVIVKRLEKDETGDGTHREEVRVHVLRGGDGKEGGAAMPPMPPVPPMPPMMGAPAGRFDGPLFKGPATTTSIGTKEFDGIRAEGKSTVQTIPAGAIGNKNPIVVTSETWYSPELQVTMYSRQIDPRFGETIYRLTNVRRGEPPADLFKMPEDYTERSAHGRR